MTLFYYELSGIKRKAIFYTLLILILSSLLIGLYPLYMDHQSYFTSLYDKMSPKMLANLGINKDVAFKTLGYYSILFNIISIIFAIMACSLGIQIIYKNRLNNEELFYFTKPMPRKKIFIYKLSASIFVLAISFILYQILTMSLLLIVKEDNFSMLKLIQINTSELLLSLVFLTVGMVVGGFLRHAKTITIPSLITVMVFLIINIFEKSFELTIIKYLNPFSYFTVSDIIATGKYQYRFLVATVFIVFFALSFSLAIYENEELGGN